MNNHLKSIVKPDLYNTFLELSKTDLVLQSVLKKTESVDQFVNALLAAIICITDRESIFQDTVKQILESNPQIKDILTVKKDFGKSENDTSLLPKEKDS